MTFCKFESNFCKVTLKVTLNSARQITIFITILSPPLSPTNFETSSTPSLHFWRRNALNKPAFGAKFTIFQVWRHLRKRWFRVDETQILEVGCEALCRLVAFSRALGFEEVSAMTFCKFYSIFCKVTFKVTFKVTLNSARLMTHLMTAKMTHPRIR